MAGIYSQARRLWGCEMTNKQQALDIIHTIRAQEERFGVDLETRASALNVVLGLMNRAKDSRLKGLCLKAISENRRRIGG